VAASPAVLLGDVASVDVASPVVTVAGFVVALAAVAARRMLAGFRTITASSDAASGTARCAVASLGADGARAAVASLAATT
jgi:hypothetical protein